MNRLTYIGIAIAIALIGVALFAPLIIDWEAAITPNTALRFTAPSAQHIFGTDALGRDVFARVIYGARISLQVGIIVVLVSGLIGIAIGAIAGF